jgi:alkylation response protein AidB-like acyl-CoA dehydrogenase/flavin-dependent dehydrogenase/ferredoxin-like protein FixX
MPQAQFDVVIIGAGAAGLTAAIGLARASVAVAVVEAAAFPGAENWSGCVYFCENLAHPDILGPDGVEALAWERRLVERGFFLTDGHSVLGATYRDPDAFRHCYTVLRPIFDHHLAQLALRHGVALLCNTTAESLIRHDRRVIGVCTQRGPLYADLVFLAEGDTSHLVTREGYEQTVLPREPVKYLQGIKEVWELPAGAIEQRFGVGPEQGVAYEMLLRNGTLNGRPVHLNMGGFVYANRQSLSIGMVLPADNLANNFDGDPNLLMEWFENLPALRPWLRDGRRSVFGAKLIRGGGIQDVPTLIDDGLAIGGAASALGIDFPYPNFTGPANAMGLLLAQAVLRIRAEKGAFSKENLRRHYLEPLQRTHYWQDVEFLRHWPGYVKKTTFFFDKNIDLSLGSAYLWTRPRHGTLSRWSDWLRMVTRNVSSAEQAAIREDARHLGRALRVRSLWPRINLARLFLDGTMNALRDLCGVPRTGMGEAGTVRLYYTLNGAPVPAGQVPAYFRGWFRRHAPVLAAAARQVYHNVPTPLARKLAGVTRLFARQVSLLDALTLLGGALASGVVGGIALAWDGLKRLGRPRTNATPGAASALVGYTKSAQTAGDLTAVTGPAAQHWEGRLGPLAYQTAKASHIHLLWPQLLESKDAVVRAGLWHVCPAHVYETRLNPAGQLQVVVNYENCIKCETCWRLSDLVDWGRDGRHRFVYSVTSPVVARLQDDQETWGLSRPHAPRRVDSWAATAPVATLLDSGALAELNRLVEQFDAKVREFDRALGEEPRTVDPARAEYLRLLVTHARNLVQDIANLLSLRQGAHQAGLAPLVRLVRSMAALLADRQQHVERRKYTWAAADGRQLRFHHLAGIRRLLAPTPATDANGEHGRKEPSSVPDASEEDPTLAALLDRFPEAIWRDLEEQKPLDPASSQALLTFLNGLPIPSADDPTRALLDPRRRDLLAGLGRCDPSLGYRAASHLWARDLCHLATIPLADDARWTGFAWAVGEQHTRYAGECVFVPDADEFVLYAGDRLFLLPKNALPSGVTVEPLGTIGLRGCVPQRVRWAAPLTETIRVEADAFQRHWHAISSADLTAIALGMADLLCRRATEHATSRVQFPGLFWDEEARDTIGKFGAIKKMLSDIAARRYVIATLGEVAGDPLAKAVVAEVLGSQPGSITYDACQVFGGTGYSEDDVISKYFRDASTWRFLGAENSAIYHSHGRTLLGATGELESALAIQDEARVADLVRRHQTLVAEWEKTNKFQGRLTGILESVKPLSAKESEELTEAVGRQGAFLRATKILLRETQRRLEACEPAETEVVLLRVWFDYVDAESLLFEKTAGHILHPPQGEISAPEAYPVITHAEFVAAPCPYDSGDFLVKPADLEEPRFVPEIVGTDPQLTLRLHTIREQLLDQFGSPRDRLVYERYVERRHRPDEADLDFCRRKGYFRTFIPRSHGGEAWSKVEYYLLTTSANRLADVAISLTIQVNSSLGTTPVLIPREKDLPRAQKDLEKFVADETLQREVAERLPKLEYANDIQELKRRLDENVFSSPALKVLTQRIAGAWKKVERAAVVFDQATAGDVRAKAAAAWQDVCRKAPENLDEIKRRREAADLFLRWVAGGQISAFALTEPSAGSDTARVATRATLHSVPVEVESDGVLRFVPEGGKEPRYLLDAARLEFRPEKDLLRPYYLWSDKVASPLMYDEYDYETDDPARTRYYEHGPRRVHFTDVAQLRVRDGKPHYDYWELTGSKMWITNGRMCGIMCLYAKTAEGVTGFIVDRHAEGLVVGKDEAKMGQHGSPTNELSLQRVRVPRENVIGLEGRGQVNALETLNAGRAGIAMTSMAYVQDLEERSRAFAEQPAEPLAWRLRELQELRFIAEAVAFEVVGRAEHKQTKSYRLEGSIAKMLVSELYLSAIRLAEEVTGLAGQTHDFLVEKRKRDARVLTIYEGTNEIQRFFILRDLVNEVAPRWAEAAKAAVAGSGLVGELEALKEGLKQRTQAALAVFGPQLALNPNLQPSGFLLAETVAWVKAADSVLGRLAWLARRPNTSDAVEVGRRAFSRCVREAQVRLERFDPELERLRAGFYNHAIRAASLLMRPREATPSDAPVPASARPLSVLVILDPPVPGVPRPTVTAGRLIEPYRVFPEADRSALEVALRLRDAMGDGVRLQVATVGRRSTAQPLREVLSLGINPVRLMVTEHEAVSPDSAARALSAVLQPEGSFDLILGGAGTGDDGLLARLTAEALGVSFAAGATRLSLRPEGRNTELVLLHGEGPPQRVRTLPAFVAVEAGLPLRAFSIEGYLRGLSQGILVERWPGQVAEHALTYVEAAPSIREQSAEQPHPIGPVEAGRLVLAEVGAKAGGLVSVSPYEGDIQDIQQPELVGLSPPVRVLAVLGCDAEGELSGGAKATLAALDLLARAEGTGVLLVTPVAEAVQRRAVARLLGAYSGPIVLLPVKEPDENFRGRVLVESWDGLDQSLAAVVGEPWCESAFATLASRSPHTGRIALRVRRLARDGEIIALETTRVAGRLGVRQTWNPEADKTNWLTLAREADVTPGEGRAGEPHILRWTPSLKRFYRQADIRRMLAELKAHTGLVRLGDAEFIIDVGFGVGNRDGYEAVIEPLERALRELGVRDVLVGGSRKVTEELHLLPNDRQIGQSGVSVNPRLLLAIGVSGAPQHLNYIGTRATVVAFNRDPEAPLMTLNERQSRPRVFPVLGDLFETVPAFIAALRQ